MKMAHSSFSKTAPANELNLGGRRKILTMKKFCRHPAAMLTEENCNYTYSFVLQLVIS
jgi:hypothetical protein